MGHLHVRSVNSIRDIFFDFFSTSDTFAKASGLISLAEGCGGKGWPAGMICRRAGEIGALASGSLIVASLGAADFTSSLVADFTFTSGLAVLVARCRGVSLMLL